MKRLQPIAVLLTTTALSTNAFAAGENISNEGLFPKPTNAEKKDSDGFLGEVLGIPPDRTPPGKNPTRVLMLDLNEFTRLSNFAGEGFAVPDNTILGQGGFIDRPLDNGLRYSSRIRLNFDTSFTGNDRLRVNISSDREDSLFGGLDDVIYGGGQDTLSSGAEDDLIYGGSQDSIYGGAGTLFGGDPSDDRVYGGAGPDNGIRLFESDLNYALPAFGGQDTLRPAEQPRISANVRDEFAIGFNVGYGAQYEDYIGLRYDGADASITDSYDNLPSETLRLTVGAKIDGQFPNLTSYSYASDFGQANVQSVDAFGYAFPDLFVDKGPPDGGSTWPPRGNPPQAFEPFYQVPQGQQTNIVPSSIIIFQPSEPPDDVIVGTIRTKFRF